MPTIEELEAELAKERERAKALENSKARLEEESKKFKSRAQQLEEEKAQTEKAKLEEQGKLEEVLAAEREEKQKLKLKLESRTNNVLKEKFRVEVAKLAKDAHDVDAIVKFASEYGDTLQFDDESLSVSGVEDFVSKVREEKTFLFRKKALGDDENPPKGKKEDMLTEDERYRKALADCKNRKELEEVYKKFGKSGY